MPTYLVVEEKCWYDYLDFKQCNMLSEADASSGTELLLLYE